MNEKNFKPAGEIDWKINRSSGLILFTNCTAGNSTFSFFKYFKITEHNIIYIGIASQSLRKRLNQELRAKGHGTFFRSIGAVLGYSPREGFFSG